MQLLPSEDFKPTLVIPMKTGYQGDEIVYGLRSASNLPVSNLVIAGTAPWQIIPDHQMPMHEKPGAESFNTSAKMEMACLSPEVSDPFIWMADDELVLWPTDLQDLCYYRSSFAQFLTCWSSGSTNKYATAAHSTLELLTRITGEDEYGLRSYEVHGPLLVHRAPMLQALSWCSYSDKPTLKRSVYGNLINLGVSRVGDNKIQNMGHWEYFVSSPNTHRFLSTNNLVFQSVPVRRWLIERFDKPSKWEK